MLDVRKAEIYVCDNYVYFVHKESIEKFDYFENKYETVATNEVLKKVLVFNNKYFYYRSIVEGSGDDRFQSKIYMEGFDDF